MSKAGPQPKVVVEARDVEMAFVLRRKLFEPAKREKCINETGKAPIGTGWLHANKGDDLRPNYRSRLVGKRVQEGALEKASEPLCRHAAVRVPTVDHEPRRVCGD